MFARLERGKRFCHDAAAAEPESTIVFFFSNGRRKQVDDFSQLVCLFCWGKKIKKKLVSVYTDRFRGAGKSANSNRGTGAFFNG